MRKAWIDRRKPLWAAVLALLGALAAMVALSVSPALATPEHRVALVIGNAAYRTAPRLDNPVDDAKAVAGSLKQLGFQVFEGYDLNAEQMRSALSQFSAALEGSDAAIVYYSGHGVSLDGENYLLPTDIDPKTPTDLDLNAISASQVLRQMRREERTIVLILDACREDPFAEALARAKSRAVIGARGLNPIEGDIAHGALIAFATDPNNVAFDGAPGQHSPFTRALLNHIEDKGVSIETVMSRVRAEVWQATKMKQLPWVNTSIIGEFDLNPTPAADAVASQPTPAAPATQSTENLLWESAQHSNLAADYKAYLDAFPNGVFAPMARNRIAVLMQPEAAAPTQSAARNAMTDAAAEMENELNFSFADRKELQLRLAALKFDVGAADGDFGDKARAAIRAWQSRHDLKSTGFFDAEQVAMLRQESDEAYQRLIAPPPAHIQKPPIAILHPAPAYEEPRRRTPLIRPHGQARAPAEGPRETAQPTPRQTTDQFLGGCQEGFHPVPAPTPSGTRCVQNGY